MEFKGNKSIITPEGCFIIGTYDENGTPNAMNAAWGMQSDTAEITLMLSKHKTTENFEKNVKERIAEKNGECPNCGYQFSKGGKGQRGGMMGGQQRGGMMGGQRGHQNRGQQMPGQQRPDAQSGATPQGPMNGQQKPQNSQQMPLGPQM